MMVAPSLQRRLLPLAQKSPGTLLVHEIYRSLQGESAYQGLPCAFVRTAVCDLRCVWCDTPHAFTQGTVRSVESVLAEVESLATPIVEITGGEPLLQPEVLPLMTALCDRGYVVLLETGGHRDLSEVDRRVHVIMDLKCPESGEEPANRWSNLDHLKPGDEIKFVVASEGDFRWAEAACREHHLADRVNVLFSPAFGSVAPIDLARWLLESRLNARMQLQLHKLVWDPKARGV